MQNFPLKKKTVRRTVHSLFFIMFRNYSFVIVSFALLTGIIFLRLYSKSALDTNKSQLTDQAKAIATRVAEFVDDDDYITYPSFLEVLEELETSDIWIVTNPENPMPVKYTNTEISAEAQPELTELLKTVFSGSPATLDVYSETYGASYIFAASPIKTSDGKTVGAVFVNQVAEGQRLVVSRSFTLITISTLIALLISLFIAVILTRHLAGPISKMRQTALRLADEDYTAHTGIVREGEIGELAGAIDVLSDRLNAAAEDRKSIEQMRRDFFANVSHELRTPITVVRAYSETLSDGIVTDETSRYEYYHKILTECKSMERLVGDLLSLSKLQNPDFAIEKEPLNIVQVFNDILRSASAIAVEKEVKINFGCDKEVLLLFGDYERIRQMLMVIIDNAVKFSETGGQIDISVNEENGLPALSKEASPSDTVINMDGETYRTFDKKLVIKIEDHGIGISDEELPYIFDKFYKSKLRQNAKGSGLGLSIAKQIALRHGGNIDVCSAKGKGTIFTFEFAEIFEGA